MQLRQRNEATLYEILEVSPAATGRDIHSAYIRAKETYSPESPALYTMFTPEEARELLKLIEEAFATLSNQLKRKEYDLRLAKEGHPAFSGLVRKESNAYDTSQEKLVPVAVAPEEGAALKNSRPLYSNKDNLPDGFAKTRFGVYEVNKKFEQELEATEECDGNLIQKIRQYKKVNLDQVAEATRISKSYLSAIEANAKESLPAPVFVRGFVLQVIRVLGAPEKVVDAFMKNYRKPN